jgi:hypothetical protein
MKSIYKQTLLVCFLAPIVAFAQVERTKEITKNYTVSAQGSLSIDNKYGDVHIETWEQNKVVLEITITAVKSSASKAEEYLEKVEIDISDGNKNDLAFKTILSGNINNRNNERLEIDYNVKAPSTFNMNLKNSYGNMYMGNSTGNSDIKVAYGNLKADELTGEVNLRVSYGNGEVDKVGNGSLVVNYSNLSIDDLGNVDVTNNYSNIELGKGGDADISNKYGNVTLEAAKSLKGYSKYGSVKIEKLYESIVYDLQHGGGLKVYWISKDFTKIDIESSYASVTLNFEKGMSAEIDAEMKYCDLKNYDIPFDHTFVDESGTQKIYRGTLGAGGAKSRILINSGYGNVKMSYVD